MVAGSVLQEANLFSVPATPFAQEEVHLQANSLKHRQFSIKSLRLKAAGLLATRRNQRDPFGKGFRQVGKPIHSTSDQCHPSKNARCIFIYFLVGLSPKSLQHSRIKVGSSDLQTLHYAL